MLDEKGSEIPDPTPLELPLNWTRPPSINDIVRQMVRNEISEAARSVGVETFEEADDFDVGDDYDPKSPWEMNYDQESAKISTEGSGDSSGRPDTRKSSEEGEEERRQQEYLKEKSSGRGEGEPGRGPAKGKDIPVATLEAKDAE